MSGSEKIWSFSGIRLSGKKSLIYFDDAVKSLGDVMVVKDGKGVRLEKSWWYEVENFVKKIVL